MSERPEGASDPGLDPGQGPGVEEASQALGRILEREQETGALDPSAELDSVTPEARAVLEGMLEDIHRIRSHRATIGAPPVSGDSIGRYKLLELLGRGSSSTVWRARDPHVGRFVAVKILHPEHGLSERQLRRFERESRIAGGLSDPSVLTLLDIGVDRGLHYIVLECIEGGQTLRDLLEEERRVVRPPSFDRRSARFLLQVAQSVGMLHDKGIVHRDLKPANILIRSTGVPVVGDLGLATDAEDRAMATSRSGAGSPFYRSPEQVREERGLDARSDVFSLGVIIYEALTSRRPFEGSSTQEVNQQILDRDPLPPRQVRRQIPRDLETICLQALEKDPARRYASAEDLAEDLRRFLDHRTILARRASQLRRLSKLAYRRPVLASSVVSLVLLLLVGAYALQAMNSERLATRSSLETAEEALRVLAPGSDLDPARTRTLVELMASSARERSGTSPMERARQLLAASSFAMKFGHFDLSTETATEAAESAEDALASGGQEAVELLLGARLAQLRGLREASEFAPLEQLARSFLAEAPRKGMEYQRCMLLLEVANALAAQQDEEWRSALGEEEGSPEELARAVIRELEESDHRDASVRRLELQQLLARFHHHRHQYLQAYELLDGVFGELRDRYGLHHYQTIQSGILLAKTVNWGLGEKVLPDASWNQRELAELIWPAARTTLGDDARTTISARWILAEAMLHDGHPEEALEHYSGVQRSLLTWESPDSDRNLHLTEAVAVTLMHCGRHEEAEPIFRQMIPIRSERKGPEHFDALIPRVGLAQVLERTGRYGEASDAYHDLFEIFLRQKDALGRNRPLRYLKKIAKMQARLGRLEEVEQQMATINQMAPELGVLWQALTPRLLQLGRDCTALNTSMAAGDHQEAALVAERMLAVTDDEGFAFSKDLTEFGGNYWPAYQGIRSAATVRLLTGHQLEEAPWMQADIRVAIRYRNGQLEEARELLRDRLHEVLGDLKINGRAQRSAAWYLARVLHEELESIPPTERTPEESHLLETVLRTY